MGVVYLAKEFGTDTVVVAKCPKNRSDVSDWQFLEEKCHPNVIQVLGLYPELAATFIVLPWCEGGDLAKVLWNMQGRKPSEGWVAKIFIQILRGTSYIHQKFEEVHNDLKAENVLLDRVMYGPEDVPNVMLADFGCSTKRDTVNQAEGGGDPRYRAPETFNDALFGFATDSWALGATLHELLTGGLLIYTNTQNVPYGFYEFTRRHPNVERRLMNALRNAHPVPLGHIQKGMAYGVLDWMLEVEPKWRCRLSDALRHPFFDDVQGQPLRRNNFESYNFP